MTSLGPNGLARPEPLTIGEAAAIVGFSREAIHKAIVDGRLRFTRIDGRRMIDLADLRDLERRGVAR